VLGRTGSSKWCKQCEGSGIRLNIDSSWNYDLQHAGCGLSKSTALGFASKGINTCNVRGCELARKGWEGVNDFRLYNGLINNVQAIERCYMSKISFSKNIIIYLIASILILSAHKKDHLLSK